MSDSALVQELTSTRASLRQAIELGEGLQRRVDAALFLLQAPDIGPMRERLIEVLKGKL